MPTPEPHPKIVAAIPLQAVPVYRMSYDYGATLAAGTAPEQLVGIAVDEAGGAYPILLDDGYVEVLRDDEVATDLGRTSWYRNRNGRAA
jgi:hypothetical protein